MRRAVEEARLSARSADVPVGALVLDADATVLAAAHNAREMLRDPTAHAEMLAVRAAAERLGRWRLDGCTVVVTVEPCAMCAGAIALSRVSRVIFGAWEPKTGAAGSVWDVLRDRRALHRPEVIGGVLADDCAALMKDFFGTRR
jgi:tRNA(adenine34) deaminase